MKTTALSVVFAMIMGIAGCRQTQPPPVTPEQPPPESAPRQVPSPRQQGVDSPSAGGRKAETQTGSGEAKSTDKGQPGSDVKTKSPESAAPASDSPKPQPKPKPRLRTRKNNVNKPMRPKSPRRRWTQRKKSPAAPKKTTAPDKQTAPNKRYNEAPPRSADSRDDGRVPNRKKGRRTTVPPSRAVTDRQIWDMMTAKLSSFSDGTLKFDPLGSPRTSMNPVDGGIYHATGCCTLTDGSGVKSHHTFFCDFRCTGYEVNILRVEFSPDGGK